MKMEKKLLNKICLPILMLVFISKIAVSQSDSTAKPIPVATTPAVKQDTKEHKDKKKKFSEFIIYASGTFNQLAISDDDYTSTINPGWALGVAYKRGNFFYWQAGLRYNNAIYDISANNQAIEKSDLVPVTDIDIPLNVGINILSITEKVIGLRVFVGAVPAFLVGVGASDYPNLTKSNANSFNIYGQGGVGVDLLFLCVDAGFNYGFQDVFENTASKPGQIFVNIGVRF